MRLIVITPVGPGHQRYVNRAVDSVKAAKPSRVGFSTVRHALIDDTKGKLGRSKARNQGMEDADYYFFLDADDCMRPDALELCDFNSPATFGTVFLASKRDVTVKNIHPCGWREIALYGCSGTLSMGFFCRADVAKHLRFDETLDAAEDFDFYMRLPSFTKHHKPLVDIGYDIPSAVGPRGYIELDWTSACNRVIAAAVDREPWKYDLGGYAVLAKANGPDTEPRPVPPALSVA